MVTSIERAVVQVDPRSRRSTQAVPSPGACKTRERRKASTLLLPAVLACAAYVTLLLPEAALAQTRAAAATGDKASLLLDAAKRGDAARIRALVRGGADAAATDADGWTALMFAAIKGHDAAVKALIDAGAPLNAQARDGASALMLAAFMGHAGAVRTLLAAGADAALRNRTGQSAADLAQARGQHEIVALLARAPQPGRPAAPPPAAGGALEAEHLLAAPTPAEFPELPAVIYEHPAFRGAPPARVSVVEIDGKEQSRLLMQDGIAQRWSSGPEKLRVAVLGGLVMAHSLSRDDDDRKVVVRSGLVGVSQISGSLFPLRVGNRLRFVALHKYETSRGAGNADGDACGQRPYELPTQLEVAGRVPGAGFGVPGEVFIVKVQGEFQSWRTPPTPGGACRKYRTVFSPTRLFFAESLGVTVPHPFDSGAKSKPYTLRSAQAAFPIVGDAGGLVSRGQAVAAARSGDAATLKRWVEQGMHDDRSVVDAAIEGEQLAALDLLLDSGVNADGPERDGAYLRTAVDQQKKAVVERLLAKGADPNAGDDGLLDKAIETKRVDIVNALIAAGADVNRIGSHGETPLMNAIQARQLEIAIALLDKGADPNRGDSAISPPGYVALNISRGAAVLMQAMVKRGLNLQARDRHLGTNALDNWLARACRADSSQENNVAAHSEGNDVVTVLLNAGARPSEQGMSTLRALSRGPYANLASCQRLFSILRTHGVQP